MMMVVVLMRFVVKVSAKDVVRFQMHFSNLMKGYLDGLKRERKDTSPIIRQRRNL